jgi:hypothetical protein
MTLGNGTKCLLSQWDPRTRLVQVSNGYFGLWPHGCPARGAHRGLPAAGRRADWDGADPYDLDPYHLDPDDLGDGAPQDDPVPTPASPGLLLPEDGQGPGGG